MNFTVKPFSELTTAELHAIYTARVAVFVVEQACPYQEVDAQDPAALHIFAEQDGKVIAYCRLIPHGDSVHLGRVLVLPEHRAEKLGRKIVAFAVDYAREHFPQLQRVRPSANLSARFLRFVRLCCPIRIVFGRQYPAY